MTQLDQRWEIVLACGNYHSTLHTVQARLGFAPPSSRMSTTSLWPSRLATYNGLRPSCIMVETYMTLHMHMYPLALFSIFQEHSTWHTWARTNWERPGSTSHIRNILFSLLDQYRAMIPKCTSCQSYCLPHITDGFRHFHYASLMCFMCNVTTKDAHDYTTTCKITIVNGRVSAMIQHISLSVRGGKTDKHCSVTQCIFHTCSL